MILFCKFRTRFIWLHVRFSLAPSRESRAIRNLVRMKIENKWPPQVKGQARTGSYSSCNCLILCDKCNAGGSTLPWGTNLPPPAASNASWIASLVSKMAYDDPECTPGQHRTSCASTPFESCGSIILINFVQWYPLARTKYNICHYNVESYTGLLQMATILIQKIKLAPVPERISVLRYIVSGCDFGKYYNGRPNWNKHEKIMKIIYDFLV